MIKFNNLNQEIPYLLLKEKYDEAFDEGQKGIEAISKAIEEIATQEGF